MNFRATSFVIVLSALGAYHSSEARLNHVSYDGHTYAFIDSNITWQSAKAYAESVGGYLVCIGSAEENTFVANLAGNVCSWIGYNDIDVEGIWQWVNGDPTTFTSWNPGEPNNGGGVEDYAEINWRYQEFGTDFGGWDDGPNDNTPHGNGTPGFVIEWDYLTHIIDEYFNHSGSLSPGWTTQSNNVNLTTPWTPVQEAGEDWAIQTSQTAFSTPFEEWLISPVYNLSGYQDIALGSTHTYTHAGSTATVKYSTNGGFSWQDLQSYTATASGNIVADISSWADNQANVRFAFVFTGQFVVGGSSWRIDDFFLDGVPAPPLASDPFPSQPPLAWGSLTGDIGCTWQQPLGVSGTDLEVRIDANGDGDYSDGGSEDWSLVADLPDASPLTFTTSVTYLQAGTHQAYEFRARSGQGAWGYSGTSNAEGIADDWFVSIDVDTTPPHFANPIPADQPTPAWLPTLQPQVGVTVLDEDAGVDASTLAWRIDLDRNGSYSGPMEDWQSITGYTDGPQIDVIQTATLPADGEYRVEFRAQDLAGNGPAYSLGEEGITDDIIVRVDATPPTASTLFVSSSGLNSVTLMFSPTIEDHFARYEFRCSTDTLVDETDQLWTDAQDPALAQISTYQTIVTGLSSGTTWFFRLWAVDLAGNRSPASNRVRKVTEGSEVSPVADLHASVQGSGILLSWTAPTTDIYGQSPVAIEHYEVHSSINPWFTPNAGTRIGTTANTSYLIPAPVGDVRASYRVVVVGAGPGQLFPVPMILVPAGTFQMGHDGIPDATPVHVVTLTNDFMIGIYEVTNSQYIDFLIWQFNEGHITVVENDVVMNGNVILHINQEYMIGFVGNEFLLNEVYYGVYHGQASDNHPVTGVTFYGAIEYCDWLSAITGLEPFYNGNLDNNEFHNPYLSNGYRLPTSAEWEYADQYNDHRIYPWGDFGPLPEIVNAHQWYGGTTPVGSFPDGSGLLGIMDMAGNVWEYCNDWSYDYTTDSVIDPIGPEFGTSKIYKGGSWLNTQGNYMYSCSFRVIGSPISFADATHGFRICKTIR